MSFKRLCYDSHNPLLINDELEALAPEVSCLHLAWIPQEVNLIDLIKMIPPTVTELALSSNRLANRRNDYLVELVQSIPSTITYLDLSRNNLGVDALIALASALPPTVNALNLEFSVHNFKDLMAVINAIPPTITCLYLYGNDGMEYPGGWGFKSELLEILDRLIPQGDKESHHILTKCLIYRMEHLLKDITKTPQDLLYYPEWPLPTELNIESKNVLINTLETMGTPIALWIAALLNDLPITIYYDSNTNISPYEHSERCQLTAVKYYFEVLNHANSDEKLKKLCHGRLWRMRQETSFVSVFRQINQSPDETIMKEFFLSYGEMSIPAKSGVDVVDKNLQIIQEVRAEHELRTKIQGIVGVNNKRQLIQEGRAIPVLTHFLRRAKNQNNEDNTHLQKTQHREITQNELYIAITNAQSKYAQHYRDCSQHARGQQGWFSWFRHGQLGQMRAYDFKNKTSNMNFDALINELDRTFISPKTRYHRHSYASYLLDEIFQVIGEKTLDKYAVTDWVSIKDKLNNNLSIFTI